MSTLRRLFGLEHAVEADPNRSELRLYDVHGTIAFVMASASLDVDLVDLRNKIIKVDVSSPWKDQNGLGEKAESIKYLSPGDSKIDNWSIPEKTCFFTIYPHFSLTKGQLLAYENYLATLAQKLSRMKEMDDVHAVISSISISSPRVFFVK